MVIIAGSNQANKFTLIRVVNHKWSVLSSCFFFLSFWFLNYFFYIFFFRFILVYYFIVLKDSENSTGVSEEIFWRDGWIWFLYMSPISSYLEMYIRGKKDYMSSDHLFIQHVLWKIVFGFIFFLFKKKKVIIFLLMVSHRPNKTTCCKYKTDPFNN